LSPPKVERRNSCCREAAMYLTTRTGPHAIGQVDLKNSSVSNIAGATGMFAPRWSPDGRYLSSFTADNHKLMLLDLTTGQWSDLSTGKSLNYPNWSRDGKFVISKILARAAKSPG